MPLPPDFERFLAQTLADAALSRGERQALRAAVNDAKPDANTLRAYRRQAFELATSTLNDTKSRAILAWLENIVEVFQVNPAPETHAEALFSPNDDCVRRIAGLIDAAKKTIDACVFTITDDRLTEALLAAHGRGIAVRIITDNDKSFDRGSDIDRLRAAGLPVRIDQTEFHMHHKFALFDGALLLNGSYNWTRGAARDNLENFAITSDRRLAGAFAQEFDRLWQRFDG